MRAGVGRWGGGTILTTADGGTTWISQQSGTDSDLRSVVFTDASRGWTAGYSGMILTTADGGTTWISQQSGTDNHLLSVVFTDASRGWTVGSSGTILTTADGGTTWIPQQSGTDNDLLSVVFTDASRGWAVGGSGTVKKITVTNDASISTATTIDQYSEALKYISNEFGVDLNLFKTNVETDKTEAADIARKLRKVNDSIEQLKGNSKKSDKTESDVSEKDLKEEDIGFMDPLRNLSPDASMTLNLTRVGVIGFIIYFIGILSNLYRYSLRLAAFYDSRADVLELKDITDTGFTELIGNFSPDHLNFGKPIQSPASQAVELAKELLKARKS